MEFKHITVLKAESVDMLRVKDDGVYVDGTLGGGGHSALICKRLNTSGTLIGIDRDSAAIEAASERLKIFDCHVEIVRDNFFNITNVLNKLNISDGIDGAILDLGVSSPQLDNAGRGFSYNSNAPLDMRMDNRSEKSAKTVVNEYEESALADVIFKYGEERYSRRIAAGIVRARNKKPIETTAELADIIKRAYPGRADKHPAKRTFQAIRIEVNSELDGLKDALKDFAEVLKPGGRLAVITFHSLEDRIVKQTFKELSTGCICPREFPVCVCGQKPKVKIITRKPIEAGKNELDENSRAHSAKLRVIEKL